MIRRYAEIAYMLFLRDVRVRYRETFLGFVWAILSPLLQMVVLTLVLSRVLRPSDSGVPYALIVFSGLVPWTFFSLAIASATEIFRQNASIITRISTPLSSFVLAVLASRLLDLVILYSIFASFAWYIGAPLHAGNLIWISLTSLVFLTAGLCMVLAVFAIYFRDTQFIVPLVLQLGFFASPVVYSLDLFPEKARMMLMFNPMAGIIEAFRSGCFAVPYSGATAWYLLPSAGAFVLGCVVFFIFRRGIPERL